MTAALRSVLARDLVADELDCLPIGCDAPAGDVTSHANGSGFVQLPSKPAVAPVSQPEANSAIPEGSRG